MDKLFFRCNGYGFWNRCTFFIRLDNVIDVNPDNSFAAFFIASWHFVGAFSTGSAFLGNLRTPPPFPHQALM
jgi:hypothetical protein